MDIQPINPGHILVVPKRHKELIAELDKIARAIKKICDNEMWVGV